MAVFSGLVRRVAAEAERQVRGGIGLLVRLSLEHERVAELERVLPAYGERIRRLEETVRGQDAGLRALRAELDSLIAQLNDRMLPRVDERMDDIERDLAILATGLIRTGKESAESTGRLDMAERRLAELRGKLAQMEQRAGLWRELQASVAQLGDDVDALRGRLAPHAPAGRVPGAPAPAQ
ncbi:hypothetical protein [Actinomadura macrotermitis]|uniref:Uncharacterized protein n=1 Tax=Actinomadura macrotermitis TaxID=2585200 RepID=A0A7K0C7T6_9ACTN|nr:hypothetical protein [Actinomadura macrotermitis]MQY09406.1 hypothetical protein [Actinomadura macrotermitis]